MRSTKQRRMTSDGKDAGPGLSQLACRGVVVGGMIAGVAVEGATAAPPVPPADDGGWEVLDGEEGQNTGTNVDGQFMPQGRFLICWKHRGCAMAMHRKTDTTHHLRCTPSPVPVQVWHCLW